jgi:hypothetical protein
VGGRQAPTDSSFERRTAFSFFSYLMPASLPTRFSHMQKQSPKKGELKVHRTLFYKSLTRGDT